MDGKQACLGSLLLAGSGTILVATGTAAGRALLAAGGLAFAVTAVHSVSRATVERPV